MKPEMFEALKTLGYRYITRDMDGKLDAWVHRPIRYISVVAKHKNRIKEKYKDAVIYDVEDEENENNKYEDGCNVSFCGFSRSKEDRQEYRYTVIPLNPDEKEFDKVTWENSPYEI